MCKYVATSAKSNEKYNTWRTYYVGFKHTENTGERRILSSVFPTNGFATIATIKQSEYPG